jgi:hypothetical protein
MAGDGESVEENRRDQVFFAYCAIVKGDKKISQDK